MGFNSTDEERERLCRSFGSLHDLVERLRGPGGCPWDRVQTARDLRTYILEEVYEVIDAIDREDGAALKEELGDLLFQVLFMSSVAAESGAFDLVEVIDTVQRKMVRRHPHVFGDAEAETPDEVVGRWTEIKAREREDGLRGSHGGGKGHLDGLPRTLPALYRAHKLAVRASRVGFDWPDVSGVLGKVDEELGEVREALAQSDRERQREEIGDLLFTVANLSRHCGIDPEQALMACNARFLRRFHRMESLIAENGGDLAGASPDEMERRWQQAKSEEPALRGPEFLSLPRDERPDRD